MREELDSLLCAKYPKIFKDRNSPMTETAMCWGLEVGDGWYDIINQLCGNIQSHIDWKIRVVGNPHSANYTFIYAKYLTNNPNSVILSSIE